jgi:hypothetical protein
VIVGDDRLSAIERLDVYANMYFFRLLEVLGDDYSKVAAAVGNDAFHDLVTDYLVACPPAHPSIARCGAGLPAFLEGHHLTRQLPWLPALATLERTYSELFDGPDAETLALDEIRALPPAEIMALTLQPIPCHRLLTHGFAIDALWSVLDQGPPAEVAATPETVLVWRPEVEVQHRVMEEDERQIFSLLDGQRTLAQICEASPSASIEEAAQSLFNVLARWISDGLLVRV